ncbi:TIGR03773 family transporter-associated surface protein [Actinomyces sp. B33]|uniref:TIGR03773 family transporter-associated surface protein n=1 Tax=Actinomyces sp. B33 TaxID=2942131 RepID=UPI002340BE98|nr:TIGR03773 family transporter-associated surface protein [Actinomyces sp. B33]MDC4232802.1 TIGR03773 family transporter-associated surface protein [Actinomyces sp. B33]
MTLVAGILLALVAPIAHAADPQPVDVKTPVTLTMTSEGGTSGLLVSTGVGASKQEHPAQNVRIVLPASTYTREDLPEQTGPGYAGYIRYSARGLDEADASSLRFDKVRGPSDDASLAVYGQTEEGDNQQILTKDGKPVTIVEEGAVLTLSAQEASSVWLFSASGDYEVDLSPVTGEGDTITLRFHVEKSADEGADPGDADTDDEDSDAEEPAEPNGDAGSSGLYIAPSNGIRRLSDGHVDAFYLYNNRDDMRLLVKDDSSGNVLRRPEDVVFVIQSFTYETGLDFGGTVPETAGYTTAGSRKASFSPGWTLNSTSGNGYQTTKVEFTEVSGPGKIVLGSRTIDNTFFSYLDDGRPYVETGTKVKIDSHKHPTWFFTRAGTYTMKARLVGTDPDGTTGYSPEVTYTWEVEHNDQDPNPAGPADSPSAPAPPDTPGDTPDGRGGKPGATPGDKPVPPSTGPVLPKPEPPTETKKVVLDSGHIDLFNVTPVDGKMVLAVKEDTPTREAIHKPSDVVIKVSDRALMDLPGDYASNLAPRGYFLDKNGDKGLPYPGWDTVALRQMLCPKAPQSCPPIDIKFLSVSGPGSAFLFDNAGSSPTQILRDADQALTYKIGPGTFIHQEEPGHQHAHWLFTDPGVYSMTVRVSEGEKLLGRSGLAAPATSNTETFTWVVGDNTPLPPGFGTDSSSDSKPGADKPGSAGDNTNDDNTGKAPKGEPEKPKDTGKQRFSAGHFDLFNVVADKGKILLNAKEDTTGTPKTHRPENLILEVTEASKANLPDNLHQNLAPSGYYLPESVKNTSKMLWPGWDTNGVRPDFGAVDIKFLNVTAPEGGKAYLFKDIVFQGLSPVLASKSYELASGEMIHQDTPGHVHASWLFTAPGEYTMTVQAEATPVNGGPKVSSQPATYTWVVGGQGPAESDKDDADAKKEKDAAADSDGKKDQSTNTQQPGGTASEAGSAPTGNAGAKPTTAAAGRAGSAAAAQCFPTKTEGSGEETLLPRVKDDRTVPAQWVDPAGLAFAVGDASKVTTNQAAGSIPSGTTVWMIGSAQKSGIPWLGANTQSPSYLERVSGPMTMSVTSFSGPGTMEVFTSGTLGMAVGDHWFSGNGGQGSGSVSIPANTHVHPNWVFTKAGTYTVGITMSATTKDGKELSGSTTLTFNVGSGDGVTDGHFDLGPEVGAAGSSIVWKTKDGKPCVPTAADLLAAGMDPSLASTGANDVWLVLTGACLLALVGFASLRIKRTI